VNDRFTVKRLRTRWSGAALPPDIPAHALYTDPPLGRAGMTAADVRTSGRRALIGKIAMEDVSRAFEKGETEGFVKILIDADTKEILRGISGY
jgi:pyruvate/2-oxoglutarate dehydrogenase complex dihydrolipoamide dehydrogenase (E3) component